MNKVCQCEIPENRAYRSQKEEFKQIIKDIVSIPSVNLKKKRKSSLLDKCLLTVDFILSAIMLIAFVAVMGCLLILLSPFGLLSFGINKWYDKLHKNDILHEKIN